ncbi:sensor domain-containing protein [Romboutsia sp.]|uniref:sensor domain-containing protein n=1 Tax=Romboutsia sp. TaxID=1965302 RepID=UPI002D153F8F|nr:EAL domain-containing protein [Romboutsia sp.]HSQ90275.1 EAL domain-containing protein [Romboutsia sp.]
MKEKKHQKIKENTESTIDDEIKHINLKFKALLNVIPYMAWFTDIDSNYCEVNNEFIIHCGKELKDIKGRGHKYVWEGKIGDECRQYDLKVINTKEDLISEEIVPGKRGYRRFNVHRSPVIDEKGEVIGVIAVARDITEIKNRDTQFQILIENIPFEVWLRDKDGVYVNANTKFAKSIETTVEQLVGKNLKEFYNKEKADEILEEDMKVMSTKQSIKFTKDIVEKNKRKNIEVYKTPVFNIANEVIGIVGTLVDITKIKEAENEIKKQAYTDSHTGLLNRRALYEYMNNKFKGNNITMMIMDVDNFKQINDTYGHHVGDKALIKIANKLKELCHEDSIFRFGGDEFIIIFRDMTDKKIIEDKARQILSEISKIEGNERQNDKINVSIGISICRCDGENCIGENCKLITMADIALYKAKECGKNRYVLYTKGLEDERILKFNIEKDLNRAIEKDEIRVFYQPQYTKDNKLRGFEALFRWDNEKYSHIPIIEVIDVMEKSDLIINIGNEIIKKACTFAKKINENRNDKIIVSFNVSSVQIMDDKFIEFMKCILKETEVCASCIGIEITETVLLENIKENIQKLKELKESGIKIALDDFGTGYSSFNYLVKLPLSEVKIDKSFVIGMDVGKEYTNLIKLIIDSCHSLKLPIVAEGVETQEQLKVLKGMDIDYIQGYLFSKPLEEKDALNLVID